MQSNKMFLFLFIYIIRLINTGVVSNRLTELEDNAKNSKIKSSWLNPSTSKVFIGNTSYEIYVFHHTGVENFSDFFDDTLAKFYTSINCIFAEWTRDQLFKLIEPIPLLYQTKFLDKYNDIFLKRFKKLQTVVNQIIDITENFINILMNFVNIYLSVNDTSNDTYMLRLLLSLNFKILFIRKLNIQPYENEKYDSALVRMMLSVLNRIQYFIFLNCKLPSYYSNKQFYGLSENHFEEINITELFHKIKPLNLESPKRCSVKQMILLDMIPRTFGQIRWKIQYGIVTIKHFMQNFQILHDLEIIYWCQNFIFNTLTKLLLTKILNHYAQHKNISKAMLKRFETIHSTVLSGIVNLPTKTVECFSLLVKKKGSTYIKKFTSYIKSFIKPNVEDSYFTDNDLKKSITVCLKSLEGIELETNSDSISSNEGFDNVSENLNKLPISTLEEYIVYLEFIVDDLKCFIRLFEFLHSENNTYNVPLAEKNEKIKLFEQNLIENMIGTNEKPEQHSLEEEKQINREDLNCQGCYYFRSVYHYCLDTIIHLNMANNENINKDKKDYDIQVNSNLERIKEFLLELTNEYWYLPHFIVVYNIIPLVELLTESKFSIEYYDIKRLVLVIMTELNNYSIEFCNPSEFNYLFFNNINFDMFGLLSTQVNNEILTSMTALKKHTKGSDRKYSRIRDLFERFYGSYLVLENYSNITLIWKGKEQKIGNIYNSFVFAILGPPNLYATFNFYFKFSIAILYYEVYNAYNLVPNFLKDLKLKYNFEIDLKENKFPLMFKEIITRIKHFNTLHTYDVIPQYEIEEDKKYINSQFEKFGISIDFSKSNKKKHDTAENIKTEEDIDSFLEELFKTTQLNVKDIINFINNVIKNFERNCVYGKT